MSKGLESSEKTFPRYKFDVIWKELSESLNLWLDFAEKLTEYHKQRHGGIWTMHEQINHVHSELSEVYTTLRKREPESQTILEMLDVIMSACCLMTVHRIERTNYSTNQYQHGTSAMVKLIVEKLLVRGGYTITDE